MLYVWNIECEKIMDIVTMMSPTGSGTPNMKPWVCHFDCVNWTPITVVVNFKQVRGSPMRGGCVWVSAAVNPVLLSVSMKHIHIPLIVWWDGFKKEKRGGESYRRMPVISIFLFFQKTANPSFNFWDLEVLVGRFFSSLCTEPGKLFPFVPSYSFKDNRKNLLFYHRK